MITMYNMYFDICAFFTFILLLVYHSLKKKLPFMQYRLYTLLIVYGMATTFFDTMGAMAIQNPFVTSPFVKYSMNILYYTFECLTMITLLLLSLCLAKIDIKLSFHRFLVWAPLAAFFIMLVTTGATKLFFYFDEAGHFCKGIFFNIIYTILLYYLVYIFVITIVYRTVFSRKQIVAFGVIIAMTILTVVIQAIFPQILLQNFTVSLSAVIMIFFIQNPEEVYESTGAMKYKMFVEFLDSEFISRKKFLVIVVHIRDYRIIQEKLGSESVDRIYSDVIKFLSKLEKDCIVSMINNRAFAIKMKYIPDKNPDDYVNAIIERFNNNWNNGNDVAVLTQQTAAIRCPEDIRSISEYYDAVEAIMEFRNIKKNVLQISDIVDVVHIDAVRTAVRNAVVNGGFEVYYQPIYSTEKKKIIAAEALVRLIDPEIGFISPEVFIPMAEKEGFILDIGEFVFESVCRFIRDGNVCDKGIEYIEVNLSPVQCMQYRLADRYIRIMKDYDVKPQNIVFEITETAAIGSPVNLTRNVDTFISNGVKFALDDYGTGYSNLSYVYALPFECVKIDKSILWSSLDNPKAYATLKNTFYMLQQLGTEVVMEGVETIQHIEKLLELKCDYFQGYYFSKAVPGVEFLEYLNNFSLSTELSFVHTKYD